jgi:hypothetical protein
VFKKGVTKLAETMRTKCTQSAKIISLSFNYFEISMFEYKNAGLLGMPYTQSVRNVPLSHKYVGLHFSSPPGLDARTVQPVASRFTDSATRWGARFSAHVQTGPGAHPASCTMGNGSFPGVKRPGRGADHPRPPSAEVENEYSYTSTPPLGPW